MPKLFVIAVTACMAASVVAAQAETQQGAKISDGALDKLSKSTSPKLFKSWGQKGFDRINAATAAAVDKTSKSPKCDVVTMSGYSFDRSSPKDKTFSVFTDCANGERFYFTEAEAIDPSFSLMSVNEKISYIDESDAMFACRDLAKTKVLFPSTIDISVLNTSVEKTQFGVSVALAFDAKNAAGAMLPYVAHCTVKETGEAELLSVKER